MLESDDGITINIYTVSELYLDQEETYISNPYYAYTQEQGYDTVHIRSPDT